MNELDIIYVRVAMFCQKPLYLRNSKSWLYLLILVYCHSVSSASSAVAPPPTDTQISPPQIEITPQESSTTTSDFSLLKDMCLVADQEEQQQYNQNALKAEDFTSELPWLDDFHNGFANILDNSTAWLNNQFDAHQQADPVKPKAWAKLILGWEPKEGRLNKFPLKFKIKMRIPNLKNRVNLIFSDNELANHNRLPLEQARPTDENLDKKDFSAAIQLLHSTTDHSYFRSRLGIASGQIYARSAYHWQKKYKDAFSISIEPSFEYYIKDGFGYRWLTQLSYFPNDNSELRAFYSIWDRESFTHVQWKKALYHLTKLDAKSTLISGVLVNGVTGPIYRDEKVTISIRYRRHTFRRWLFYEVEPFFDFEREDNHENRFGIALRVGGYFGYQ